MTEKTERVRRAVSDEWMTVSEILERSGEDMCYSHAYHLMRSEWRYGIVEKRIIEIGGRRCTQWRRAQ